MFDKIHTTVTRCNGIQLSVELKRGERWHYLGAGYHHGFDLVTGSAGPEDVTDTFRRMASEAGESPVRYAAAQRDNLTTRINTR